MRRLVATRLVLVGAVLLAGKARAQPRDGRDGGVTLFTDTQLEGRSESFGDDEPDVARTRLGNRRVRSVRVAEGCRVLLFEGRGFRGRTAEILEDDNDLGNAGFSTIGSLRVRCDGSGGSYGGSGSNGEWGELRGRGKGWNWNEGDLPSRDPYDPRASESEGYGVTLFRDRDLRGPSQTFNGNVPDLRNSQIGARRASSIRVPRGCTATLYRQPGFRGRSTEFRDDDRNLGNTSVGEDTASSLRVDCGGGRRDDYRRDEYRR